MIVHYVSQMVPNKNKMLLFLIKKCLDLSYTLLILTLCSLTSLQPSKNSKGHGVKGSVLTNKVHN